MAATETLSFDRHLRHAFAPLSGRLENGIRSLDGVIEMLRLRIEAEAQFAASLQKIISNQRLTSYLSPAESLRKDGLDAIHADMRNEYTQRLEFLNSLNEDVYQPCVSMRELYAQKNRLFANDTKTHIKSLRQHQNQFYKIKSKYEKVCKEASNARTALLNAKLDNKISSAQILKLGTKVNSTLKTQQTWKEKYDQQQLIWNRQQIKFDDEMTSILQGMQSNEYNRMRTTKDSLNKWAVFITNLCANRNYDVKNLAKSMSMIRIENDLQVFIKQTLDKYPSKNPHGPTPPHHSLHYGKLHQNALHNLNKASMEKNHDSTVNTNPRKNKNIKPSSTHSLHGVNLSHHQRNRSNNSLSLSSFGPSFGGSMRKHSQSYSLSGQQDVVTELAKRNMRQQSTPNSIGSFFKQKFQKQRSYNSQRAPDHIQRENSNTISSYARDGSVVLPPSNDYDDTSPTKTILSPQSPKSLAINHIHVVNSNGNCDPEIPVSPHALSIDLSLNHTTDQIKPNASHKNTNTTNTASSAQINRTMKKKKLNKPKMRRKKKQSLHSNQSITPKANKPKNTFQTQAKPQANHHIIPQQPVSPITPMLMDKQNQNILSYTVNHSQNHMHNHNHKQPKSPSHKAIQQLARNRSRSPKQIIVIKRKKSKSPSQKRNTNNNNNNNTNNNNSNSSNSNNSLHHNINMPESSDNELSGGSTPTLSGGSDNENDNDNHDIIPPITLSNTPASSKPDTPAPKHSKKKIKYLHKSNESANLEFAATHGSNKISHSYAESEDDFDPLD